MEEANVNRLENVQKSQWEQIEKRQQQQEKPFLTKLKEFKAAC